MKKKPSTTRKFNKQSGTRLQSAIDYATAKPALKKEMDQAMDEVVSNPRSFDAVLSFGHKPIGDLGKVAHEMLQLQADFNQHINDMQQVIDKIEAKLQSIDWADFGDATRQALNADTSTQKLRKFIANVTASIPALAQEIDQLTDNFDRIDSNIRGVMKKLDKLEMSRKDVLHDIVMTKSAAVEVLRRYDADFIPAARAKFGASKDAADRQQVQELEKRREDFIDRKTIIEGSQAGVFIAEQQIRQMAETMADARKRIQDIQHNSRNEWKALLVAAGIVGGTIAANPAAPVAEAKQKPSKKQKAKGPGPKAR